MNSEDSPKSPPSQLFVVTKEEFPGQKKGHFSRKTTIDPEAEGEFALRANDEDN